MTSLDDRIKELRREIRKAQTQARKATTLEDRALLEMRIRGLKLDLSELVPREKPKGTT